MTNRIIPQLGELLRTAITRANYRGFITNLGLDKDLDDMAAEARISSTADLMCDIENACRNQLALECGHDWAQFFNSAWSYTKNTIQHLTLNVDTSAIADAQGQEDVVRSCIVPILSELILSATLQHPGLVSDQWWEKPFGSWVQWAAATVNISTNTLLANLGNDLDVDPRSIERWMAGEPVRELRWPYRLRVSAAVGVPTAENLSSEVLDQMSGWLLMTLAFQSFPLKFRDCVRRDFKLRPQQPWSLQQTILTLNKQGFISGDRPIRSTVVPLLQKIEALFSSRLRNVAIISQHLGVFQTLIDQETDFWQRTYQYTHHWLSARLAAIKGQEAEALRLYEAAVTSVWWYGGSKQHPIINEALIYAVGTGKKITAEGYWDKTFLLGLNKWPKRALDEQELRRISFGFEKMFFPQKANARIPPPMEFILKTDEFEVTPKALAKPNSKVKHAEGRARRTPLMEAVSEGTLSDVKKLIAFGGDPNDFISESGEGPLSYAFHRAWRTKDTLIVNYLLGLDLSLETINRTSSTMRETPLKLAIEIADARAVDRLIELGAKVEVECGEQPSALCYAMAFLYRSIHRSDDTQERAYFAGNGRADVFDAKEGAVLDIDLSKRRLNQLASRHASARNEQIAKEVWDYLIRRADDYRDVIHVLLHRGANANRRYKVDPRQQEQWTPTLFAAQVGDLDVFKALIEYNGDPDLVLIEQISIERQNALWVAIAYGRHSIVTYLTEHQRHPH